jgi:type IV pilus assembly protein PilV
VDQKCSKSRGFTLIEVVIALVLLDVGLLGLVGTAALVTRMEAESERSAAAANFAAQRLERLRAGACSAHANGADTLFRAATWVAINAWTWTELTDSTARKVALTLTSKASSRETRTAHLETEVSCAN